jgi:hypothetical protein
MVAIQLKATLGMRSTHVILSITMLVKFRVDDMLQQSHSDKNKDVHWISRNKSKSGRRVGSRSSETPLAEVHLLQVVLNKYVCFRCHATVGLSLF